MTFYEASSVSPGTLLLFSEMIQHLMFFGAKNTAAFILQHPVPFDLSGKNVSLSSPLCNIVNERIG